MDGGGLPLPALPVPLRKFPALPVPVLMLPALLVPLLRFPALVVPTLQLPRFPFPLLMFPRFPLPTLPTPKLLLPVFPTPKLLPQTPTGVPLSITHIPEDPGGGDSGEEPFGCVLPEAQSGVGAYPPGGHDEAALGMEPINPPVALPLPVPEPVKLEILGIPPPPPGTAEPLQPMSRTMLDPIKPNIAARMFTMPPSKP